MTSPAPSIPAARIVPAPHLTASERATKLSAALKSVGQIARICADTEALSIATLRAAMDDIAIYSKRVSEEGEAG